MGSRSQIGQVVLNLLLGQLAESGSLGALDTLNAQQVVCWRANNACNCVSAAPKFETTKQAPQTKLTDFYCVAVHLALNRFLERQQRNVNSVFQLKSLSVSLLKERLSARCVFADRCSLPRVVAATGIDLVKTGATLLDTTGLAGCLLLGIVLLGLFRLGLNALVPARYQQTDTVRPHTSGLRSFLDNPGDVLHQDPGGRVFVVDALVVCVRDLAGLVDQYPVVGAHAGVDHANIRCNQRNLGQRWRIDEGRG